MPSQGDVAKTPYNQFSMRFVDRHKDAPTVSFIVAIFVVGFGGALFSHSFSKLSVISECPTKSYLQGAVGVGIFQAFIGFFVAVVEWMEIRKHKWNGINPVKWICLLSLIVTFILWILIGNIIGKSSATELESMHQMIICNCIIVCISCIVLPNYTMCFKANESEENEAQIVVAV